MNDNVKKVFEMLGVKSYEKIKLDSALPIFEYKELYFDENLDLYRVDDGEYCSEFLSEEEACPFRYVKCSYGHNYWYGNKDMFSDKFLDQEIEVE